MKDDEKVITDKQNIKKKGTEKKKKRLKRQRDEYENRK